MTTPNGERTRGGWPRRRFLGAAAGLGAAGLGAAGLATSAAAGDAAAASLTLSVDFTKVAFFPLLKSKIGVARSLDSPRLLDSLPLLDEIRPALYNGELRFPEKGWASMTPYPIEVAADGTVRVRRSPYLDTLHAELSTRDIEIMHQLIGAPLKWHDDPVDDDPRKFPVPANLPAAADAMGRWAELYRGHPISWCMWNEPSHNLTGRPDMESIRQMVNIYDAYTSAIAPYGRFGMASFVPVDARPRADLDGRSYVEATIDLLQARRATKNLPFHYLTMNNYGKELTSIVDGARDALGTGFNTVPLMQVQYGVFDPGEWEQNAGIALEAVRSMAALERALRIPDLQVLTFSGWLGHMVVYAGGQAQRLPLFHALRLYAQMPVWRAPVTGERPDGVGVMASGDEHRGSIMVWNQSGQAQTVRLDLAGVPVAGQPTELRVYRIDRQHGSPLEGGGADLTPVETVRLAPGTRTMAKTLTVPSPGIVYVEANTVPTHPVLDRTGLPSAVLVRKHTYADRVAGAGGTTEVRDSYGAYDAVRAAAYLGVQGAVGTALCGAEYRGLPDALPVGIRTHGFAATATSVESVFGIRVDYIVDGDAPRSVLWHGDVFRPGRTKQLPWGRRGATADVLVRTPRLDAGAAPGSVVLELARYAPSGWTTNRRAIISFWMESTGAGSQARFLLG